MSTRADILAGRAVVVVDIQDMTEASLRKMRSTFRVFSNSMKEIGGDLFRGGLVGTAGSIFPVREFVNFQDQLLFLQTKLQVTDDAMVPLEKHIRQLGMSTSFSSKEVAQAATMYAQAGFNIREVTDALQAALDLSRGGQVDISTSTTILSNALRTFGADASQAGVFASKFIAAARLGTLDLVDLGQSLTYSSGTFAQLGVSIDEVLGLITNLSTAGLKASLAGTSLNTAFLNLAGSADKLKELLGITFEETDFETPLLALAKIEKALQKFPKLERTGIIQQLVNIRGGRAVFGEFLSGLGNLDKVTQQIKLSADEARVASAKLDSRLGGVGRRALSAFQELQLSLGQTTEGPLTVLGESVAAFLNDMSKLAKQNPRTVQTILAMGPASLLAGAGILTLSSFLSKLVILVGPIMVLNSALFKMASTFVGLQMKIAKGGADALSVPFISLRNRIQDSQAKSLKAYETYQAKLLTYDLKREAELAKVQERIDRNRVGTATRRTAEAKKAAILTGSPGQGVALQRAMESVENARVRQYNTLLTKQFSIVNMLSGAWARVAAALRTIPRDMERLARLSRVSGVAGLASKGPINPNTAGLGLTKTLAQEMESLKNLGKNFVVRRDLPILDPTFFMREIGRPGADRQLMLPMQLELDFGPEGTTDLFKQLPRLKDASGRFISEALLAELTNVGVDLSRNKMYRGLPMQFLLDDIFTMANLSESAKKTLATRIAEGIKEAAQRPDVQLTIPFDDLVDLTPPKPATFSQMDFDFGPTASGLRPIGTGFLNTADGFSAPARGIGGKGAAMAAREAKILAQTSTEVKKGSSALAIFGKWLRSVGQGFRWAFGPEVGKFLKGSFAVIKMFGSGLRGLGKLLVSYNYAKGFIDFTKSIGRATLGVLRLMNGIRRFVFSLSGILMIFDVILLFGDKIPGVAEGLDFLGNAFKTLFHYIGKTAQDSIKSLQKIGGAIKSIFTGDAEGGLERMKSGFSELGQTISGGLTSAWNNFTMALSPVSSIVKQIGLSLMAGFQLAIDLITTTFGTLKDGISITIGSEGSFLETLAEAFSSENIASFFATIGGFIAQIVKAVNTLISKVFEVVQIAKAGIMAMLQAVSVIPGEGGKGARDALDALDPRRKAARDKIIGLENNRDLDKEFVRTNAANAPGVKEARERLLAYPQKIAAAQAELENLGPEIGSLAFKLEERNAQVDKALSDFIAAVQAAADRTLPKASDQVNNDETANPGSTPFAPVPTPQEVFDSALADAEAEFGKQESLDDFVSGFGKQLLEGDPAMEVFDPAKDAMENIIGDALNVIDQMRNDVAKATGPQEQALAELAPAIDKIVSGDFASTRGNLLRGVPRAEKLAERTATAAETTAKNTEEIKKNQVVFQ